MQHRLGNGRYLSRDNVARSLGGDVALAEAGSACGNYEICAKLVCAFYKLGRYLVPFVGNKPSVDNGKACLLEHLSDGRAAFIDLFACRASVANRDNRSFVVHVTLLIS